MLKELMKNLLMFTGAVTIICALFICVYGPLDTFYLYGQLRRPKQTIVSTLVSPDGQLDASIVKTEYPYSFNGHILGLYISNRVTHKPTIGCLSRWSNCCYESKTLKLNQIQWANIRKLVINRLPEEEVLYFNSVKFIKAPAPYDKKFFSSCNYGIELQIVTNYDSVKAAQSKFWFREQE